MQRTTILLPNDLRRRADREAKALGISLNELIRRRLAGDESAGKTIIPRLSARQPWAGSVSSHTAANHDAFV
jgi:hypothetical protein